MRTSLARPHLYRALVALAFVVPGCGPWSGTTSWSFEECSLSGDVEWSADGTGDSLGLSHCMIRYSNDGEESVTVVLMPPGATGGLALPGAGGINVGMGLEPGRAEAGAFSLALAEGYRHENLEPGKAYGSWADFDHERMYRLRGLLKGSGFAATVEDSNEGRLDLGLSFDLVYMESDRLEEIFGSRNVTLSGEVSMRARSKSKSSGSSGGSSSGSGSGGGTSGCGSYSDGGIQGTQSKSFCQTAYAYECGGNRDGVQASCDTLRQLNPDAFRLCPYC